MEGGSGGRGEGGSLNGINGMGGSLAWARGTTGSYDHVLITCGMEGTRRDAADMNQVAEEEEEDDDDEEEELVLSQQDCWLVVEVRLFY